MEILKKLDLGGCSITSLPSCAKRLQNLMYLDLTEASDLQGPIYEISNLTYNLKLIDLSGYTKITLLLNYIGRLTGLISLSIPEVLGKNLH